MAATRLTEMGDAISKAITEAKYGMNLLDLGIDVEIGNPYDAIIAKLEEAKADVEFLKKHKHEWSDDDYCVWCGLDGRA